MAVLERVVRQLPSVEDGGRLLYQHADHVKCALIQLHTYESPGSDETVKITSVNYQDASRAALRKYHYSRENQTKNVLTELTTVMIQQR